MKRGVEDGSLPTQRNGGSVSEDREPPAGPRPLDLFSLDIDAELRKLAARTFGSPHEYVVELVRDALRRGATRVDVRTGWTRLEVAHDGDRAAAEILERLGRVFDSSLDPGQRQHALEAFLGARSVGLLAAFAPSPSRVLVESPHGSLEVRRLRGVCRIPPAPRHRVVVRRWAPPGPERGLLRELCRFADATITVNGRVVSRVDVPDRALIAGRTSGGAVVWLPDAGDMCRVHLLEHGVRWKQTALQPGRHGLVFEAALESAQRPDANALTPLRECAHRLYARLAAGPPAMPTPLRDRVEELLFSHHRVTRDDVFTRDFPAFRSVAGRMLTLRQIQALDAAGSLRVLPAGTTSLRSDPAADHVLVLTSRQREFLATTAGLRLESPPHGRAIAVRMLHAVSLALQSGCARLAGLHRARPIAEDEMLPAEALLVSSLEQHLRAASGSHCDQSRPVAAVRVMLCRGWSPLPARLLASRGLAELLVYRDQAVVRNAVRAVARDSAVLDLACAAILPHRANGHEGV